MAITTERYIGDSGSITMNTVEVNGSVKTLSYNPPRKSERTINSLGGSAVETQDRSKAGPIEVTIVALDDRSLANDNTGIVGICWTAYDTNIELTDLVIVPAGSTVGMAEYTLGGSLHVVQCAPHADLDADSEEEATQQIVILVETVSIAALA
jgi:hypothetical protein